MYRPPMVEQGYWAGKRILLVSHEAWGPVRLSKHHYASTLIDQGAQVFFLGPDELGRRDIAVELQQAGAPTIVHRAPPMRGIRHLPVELRERMEERQMRALATTCGGAFDVLWNFDLFRFRSLKDRSHARLYMLHVMDLKHPDELSGPAKCADAVIVVSPAWPMA
ncbi:MAG: hypothetical protein IPN44_08905 [Flavobacteriales bacterium]|nr:hypothetical protein [Flavobacteriales bacterium]